MLDQMLMYFIQYNKDIDDVYFNKMIYKQQ